MPFDPKLVHPEEPPLTAGGELDLPADLAALGEQLHADAAHLAAAYPPNGESSLLPQRQAAHSSYTKYAALVLGSTLAALLVTAVIWHSLPVQPAASRTAAALPPTAAAIPAASPAMAMPQSGEAVLLVELSGPELEALIDLLDRDPRSASSIAF